MFVCARNICENKYLQFILVPILYNKSFESVNLDNKTC